MRSWSKIYSKKIEELGGIEKYLNCKVKEKKLFLGKIGKYTNKRGKILEAGCGTGVLSIYLSNRGFSVTAVDVDKDMLNIAKKISEHYCERPTFQKIDLFSLEYPSDYFDLVFSHGVLEHFSDKQIITLLKKQLSISKTLIFSVPSNYLTKKDRYFGNERFLSLNKWKEIIRQTPAEIIEIFGFHYILGWKKYWDTLTRGKIFGPLPYLTFVLRKK